MADIGNLVTYLRLNDDQFNRNMKRAATNVKSNSARMNRAFAKVERSFQKVTKRVFTFRTAMAGAAAAAGMGYFIKKQLEVADAIGKTADKIGVGVEALQEFRHAAKLSGVETRTADMGLQRFSRRMGEAAQGTGEALKVVEQYGIQVRDSSGAMRSNMDIMADWAEVIRNAESEQEALRIGFKLFDSEGAAMVNMLRDGSAAFNDMREDARKLGIVLNDDLVRGAEEANDQVTRLSSVISVQFTRAVAEAAPEIAKVTQQLAESEKIRDYAQSVINVAGAFLKAAGAAAKLFDTIGRGLGIAAARAMGSKDSALEHVDSQIAKIESRVKRLRGSLSNVPENYVYRDQLQNELDQAERRLSLLRQSRQEVLGDMWQKPTAGGEDRPTTMPPLLGGGGTGAAGAEGESAFLKKVEQLHKEAQATIGDGWVNQYERMQEALGDQEQSHEEFLSTVETLYQEAQGTIDRGWKNQADAMEEALADPDRFFGPLEKEASELGDSMSRAFDGWARNWSSTLNDMLWGAEVTFNDILKSFSQMVSQMVIQKSIVEPLAEAGSSLIGGIGDWIAGLFTNAHGNAFFNGQTLAYAQGGIVNRPTVFPMQSGMGLMGEAGAEAVLPLSRMSGGDLGVKGTSAPVYVYVENNTNARAQVSESKTAEGGRSIHVLIDEAVAGNIRSPGRATHRALRDTFGARPVVGGR